jgi:hypothetical protein
MLNELIDAVYDYKAHYGCGHLNDRDSENLKRLKTARKEIVDYVKSLKRKKNGK